MTITIYKNRDGAGFEKLADGRTIINGVAAREFMNSSRVIALLPPVHDLKMSPGKIYGVSTGLIIGRNMGAPSDLRPVLKVFRECGMRVERADIEGISNAAGELVVYVSVLAPFQLNRSEGLFETSAYAGSVVAIEIMAPSVDGFSPAAVRSVQDASMTRQIQNSPQAPREPSDEEKRKRFDSFLNDAPTAKVSPAPAATPGSAKAYREDGSEIKPAIVREVTARG
jgi:hypothetical protein